MNLIYGAAHRGQMYKKPMRSALYPSNPSIKFNYFPAISCLARCTMNPEHGILHFVVLLSANCTTNPISDDITVNTNLDILVEVLHESQLSIFRCRSHRKAL
jgi:hypothetical protein